MSSWKREYTKNKNDRHSTTYSISSHKHHVLLRNFKRHNLFFSVPFLDPFFIVFYIKIISSYVSVCKKMSNLGGICEKRNGTSSSSYIIRIVGPLGDIFKNYYNLFSSLYVILSQIQSILRIPFP